MEYSLFNALYRVANSKDKSVEMKRLVLTMNGSIVLIVYWYVGELITERSWVRSFGSSFCETTRVSIA